MPVLALERDVQSDHPVVHDLRRNNLSVRLSLPVGESGGCHLGGDVIADLVKVVLTEAEENVLWNFRGQRHSLDVPKHLFWRLVLRV